MASDPGLHSCSGLSVHVGYDQDIRACVLGHLILVYMPTQDCPSLYVEYDQRQSSMASDLDLHSCSGLSVPMCGV